MLSKLTVGFLLLATTAAIVACSNLGMTTGVNVGPNFPSKTLYATNTNQNAISVYSNGTRSRRSVAGPPMKSAAPTPRSTAPSTSPSIAGKSVGDELQLQHAASALDRVRSAGDRARRSAQLRALPGRPRGIAFTPRGPSPAPSSSRIARAGDHGDRRRRSDGHLSEPDLALRLGCYVAVPVHRRPKPDLSLPGRRSRSIRSGHVYVANVQGATVEQFVLPTPIADVPSPRRLPSRRRHRNHAEPSPTQPSADARRPRRRR